MARKQADDVEAGFAAEAVESLERKATSRALKKAAKTERKAAKKDAKRHKKARRKAARRAAKDVKRAVKAGQAPPDLEAGEEHMDATKPKVTAKKARNAVSVAKVLVPAALPILTPLAVRAAGACREAYDRLQARRLGVDIDSLGEFSGHGGPLRARIAGLSDSLADLREGGSSEAAEFAANATATLRQLVAAVPAAERMPAARRKQVHRAAATELDGLESQLLRHLGV
jgi:hypothetical protein